MSLFFFSLSLFLSLSTDYVVSPPISLEKGNECAREEKPSASSRQSRGRLSRAFTPASRVQRGSRALKPIHRTHSFSRTPRIRSHASPLAPLSRRRPANPHPRVFPHDVRADPPLASRAPSLASIHPRAREITKSHARPRTCAPSAGPIGGAGDAFPASIASLMYLSLIHI